VYIVAVKERYMEALTWLLENGVCSWNEKVCTKVVKRGYLDVLKWLREKGCPWNSKTCDHAAQKG